MIHKRKSAVSTLICVCVCVCLASCSSCASNQSIAGGESYVSSMEEPSRQSSHEPESKLEASPSDTVNSMMEAVKLLDATAISKHLTSSHDSGSIFGPDFQGKLFFGDESGSLAAENYLKNISWEVLSETINGNKAKVEISITVPNLAGSFNSIAADVAKKAALQALSGKSVDMRKLLFDYLAEEIDYGKIGSVSTNPVVSLVKQDDAWLVDNSLSVNGELLDSVTGGIMDKLEEYSDFLK